MLSARRRAGAPTRPADPTAKPQLRAADVPRGLGNSYDTGHQFLASIGLLADDEATAIVDSVEASDPARK